MPEVTAEDLLKKQSGSDPIIVDVMREHANFSKQIEGHPWFFKAVKSKTEDEIGYHLGDMGATDFFESLCVITRINAALQ